MRLYYVSAKYGMKTEWSKYNIYFILALIYMWLIIINAPALVVWAKGVHLRYVFFFFSLLDVLRLENFFFQVVDRYKAEI